MNSMIRKWGGGLVTFKPQALLAALIGFLGIPSANAQETQQFFAYFASPVDGKGVFTLTDHLFTYDVSLVFGYSQAEIRGPGPASDAPVIFDLAFTRCEVPAPVPGPPGGCFFNGSEILSDIQIEELVNSQLYVWGHAPGAPTQPISGQIVPEPPASLLLFVSLGGVTALWLFRKVRKHNRW